MQQSEKNRIIIQKSLNDKSVFNEVLLNRLELSLKRIEYLDKRVTELEKKVNILTVRVFD